MQNIIISEISQINWSTSPSRYSTIGIINAKYENQHKQEELTMYKVFAPMISELPVLERKSHQGQFWDNQQQSNNLMRIS